MTAVRQTISGLPRQNGPTAFMPLRALTTGVMDNSRAQGTPEDVTGQPGTQGIPAPYPEPGQVGVTSQGDYLPSGLSASQYMPPRWYPSLYRRIRLGLTGGCAVSARLRCRGRSGCLTGWTGSGAAYERTASGPAEGRRPEDHGP